MSTVFSFSERIVFILVSANISEQNTRETITDPKMSCFFYSANSGEVLKCGVSVLNVKAGRSALNTNLNI